MSHRGRGHSRSHTRDLISLIFGFFLSLALLGIMLITVVRLGVMTWGGFNYILDDKYYELTVDYVEKQTYNYSLPTGIDPAVLDGVFSVDEVKRDAGGFIAGALDGSGYKADTSATRDRLVKNVKALFDKDGVRIGEGGSAEKIIEGYANDIMGMYEEALVIPGLDVIVQIRNFYVRYYPVALACFVAFAAIMVVLIMRLHHFVHRALRFVAYALGGAAVMGFVVPCMLLVSGFYKGLNLQPEFFYHFGVRLVMHVFNLCMLGSGVLLVLMIITMVVIRGMRKKAMHSGRLSHDF